MTTTRKLIWAFWIFIFIMLAWEFYSYDRGVTQEAIDHPQQKQFFFFHSNNVAHPSEPKKGKAVDHHGEPFLRQTAFSVHPKAPTSVMFTCEVTVKNEGDVKAVNVQVQVRPFKGIRLGDEDNGGGETKALPDNDPMSLIAQWVSFPDLKPGESATQKAVFLEKVNVRPGNNPDPQFIFEAAKNSKTKNIPKLGPGGG